MRTPSAPRGRLGIRFLLFLSWIARAPQALPPRPGRGAPRSPSRGAARARDAAVPGCGAALALRGLGGGAERGGVRGS